MNHKRINVSIPGLSDTDSRLLVAARAREWHLDPKAVAAAFWRWKYSIVILTIIGTFGTLIYTVFEDNIYITQCTIRPLSSLYYLSPPLVGNNLRNPDKGILTTLKLNDRLMTNEKLALILQYSRFDVNPSQLNDIISSYEPVETTSTNQPTESQGTEKDFVLGNTSKDIFLWGRSRIFKRYLIEKHNLMPRLFSQYWDNGWKIPPKGMLRTIFGDDIINRLDRYINPYIRYTSSPPDIESGIDILNNMIVLDEINYGARNQNDLLFSNTLAIFVKHCDPKLAKDVLNYLLDDLNSFLIAYYNQNLVVNRNYLESHLDTIKEPYIRVNMIKIIASNVDNERLLRTKENAIYSIVDRPTSHFSSLPTKSRKIIKYGFLVSLLLGITITALIDYLISNRAKIRSYAIDCSNRLGNTALKQTNLARLKRELSRPLVRRYNPEAVKKQLDRFEREFYARTTQSRRGIFQ